MTRMFSLQPGDPERGMAPATPSLMADLAAHGHAAAAPRPGVPALRRADDALRRILASPRAWLAAGVLALAAGGWWVGAHWRTFFPRPTPNVAEGDIEDALDFTLLSGDFNRLSVEERLRIVRELANRLRSGSADDSALIAAFAAGITGAARDQLRENAERLFVDVWADFSGKYHAVDKAEREKFLDQAFLDFTKLGEDLGGPPMGRNEQEKLQAGRDQAKRDLDRARSSDPGLSAQRAGQFFNFMTGRGLDKTSPAQRDQMQRFQRDMVRHLRGQDLDTGKPKGG